MQNIFAKLLLRWAGSTIGLWVAQSLLGNNRLYLGGKFSTILVAGLILALINMLLKPLLIFLSLPAIIITLGLFMFVVNGMTILIASWLYNPLEVSSFWVAIAAGIIVGFVNFLVSVVYKDIAAHPDNHNHTKKRKVIDV